MSIKNPKTGQTLEDAVVELYLDVKIRSNDEVKQNWHVNRSQGLAKKNTKKRRSSARRWTSATSSANC